MNQIPFDGVEFAKFPFYRDQPARRISDGQTGKVVGCSGRADGSFDALLSVTQGTFPWGYDRIQVSIADLVAA